MAHDNGFAVVPVQPKQTQGICEPRICAGSADECDKSSSGPHRHLLVPPADDRVLMIECPRAIFDLEHSGLRLLQEVLQLAHKEQSKAKREKLEASDFDADQCVRAVQTAFALDEVKEALKGSLLPVDEITRRLDAIKPAEAVKLVK